MRNQAVFDDYPADVKEKIRNEQVAVGFTRQMVTIALGDPDVIYTRTDGSGVTREVWTFKGRYYTRRRTMHNDFYCDRCRKHHAEQL